MQTIKKIRHDETTVCYQVVLSELFVIKWCSQNCHRLINCTLLRFDKTKKLSCQRKIAVGKGIQSDE